MRLQTALSKISDLKFLLHLVVSCVAELRFLLNLIVNILHCIATLSPWCCIHLHSIAVCILSRGVARANKVGGINETFGPRPLPLRRFATTPQPTIPSTTLAKVGGHCPVLPAAMPQILSRMYRVELLKLL